jgi:phosphatidate cytidylyltransferase
LALGFQSLLYVRYAPIYESYVLCKNDPGEYFNLFNNFESCSFAVYIGIATFVTDAGAYFVGVFFGKHKMNPRISPKKTWEGFFGGIAISCVVSFAFAFILALCGAPVLQIFSVDRWYLILILSAIIPLFSTLGDLVFSSLKRHYEIKDFGRLIPGHGGVLDRVDSLLFAAIVSAIFVSFVMSIIYKTDFVLL